MPSAYKPKPKLYNPRHPERTLLYQTVAEHYETWLDLASAGQFDGRGDHHSPKPYVRKAFEKYLECGIFVHDFTRARCDDCGHDFLVAFSCKGRGVCPSCNTRRMAETAAHLGDHVFPRLPVRQWVLSVPRRLRYFMQRGGATLGMVLRIFLRVIAQMLQANSPGAANVDKAALHIGAIAFIYRFGSSLNEHVHFHVCVVDSVFEAVAGEEVDADADHQARAPGIIYHPGTGVNAQAVTQAQATLRKRILRAFVGRGLLEGFEAKEMLGYKHSGFSVDTSVCIAAQDRAGLERLLRYCARTGTATLACWLRTRRTGLRSRRWLQRSRQRIVQHRRQIQRRAGQPQRPAQGRAQTQCGPGKRMIARPSLYRYPSNALRTFCGWC